jgi:hypothetical protein
VERARRGLLASFFETWKLVAVEPQRFFSRVRIDQTGSAVLFAVISFTFGRVVAALFAWLSGQQAMIAFERAMGRMSTDQQDLARLVMRLTSGRYLVAEVLLAPLFAVVLLYLVAGVLHLALLLLRGAPRGFDATLTAVAYSFGLYILLAVPACGVVVALVWQLVVLVIGIAESQRCGTGKAAVAVLSPAILFCICCCGLGIVGGLTGLKNLQQAAREARR